MNVGIWGLMMVSRLKCVAGALGAMVAVVRHREPAWVGRQSSKTGG
jgi:hypothetical protein